MNDLLITFYGDDFTGSTDAMECLELNGIPAVLFLDPPTEAQMAHFPDVRGMGLAGVSRTMSPEQMDGELISKFEVLKEMGAPFVHYKVCSTFDSSPTVGSIGHAIDIGWNIFEPPVIPMMAGAPFIRRYMVFGNLFARVEETTYRLDRHPTMSKHPITPMHEADLRRHLAAQTDKQIDLIDIWHLSHNDDEIDAFFQQKRDDGAQIIFFDTIDEAHMMQIGRVVWGLRGDKPVFLAGSSGFEYSLGMYLDSIGVVQKPKHLPSAGQTKQLLIVSGSCAPPTQEQIEHALAHGFTGIRLNAPRLIDPDTQDAERATMVEKALKVLDQGDHLILYSALGPDDDAIEKTNRRMEVLGMDPKQVGHQLGSQQGFLLRELLEARPDITRVCVAGGDTCGYAAKQLGIYALRMITPIAPGAPLCRASSDHARFDGLEIVLKGGQNGVEDYFMCVLEGRRREKI